MDINEYEDMPEGLNSGELKKVYDIFFHELGQDSYGTVCAKLDILCDKQWHTYELPSVDIQNKVREWIIKNWSGEEDFLELVLGVCYCFGLDKKLYEKALVLYKGEYKAEHKRDLENSIGDSLDPYWSMRKTEKK